MAFKVKYYFSESKKIVTLRFGDEKSEIKSLNLNLHICTDFM